MKFILCQYKQGCFGCCGHDFKSKEAVIKDIKDNTKELIQIGDLKKFRERLGDTYVKPSGICQDLIYKNKFYCPLHSARNNEKDLRPSDCEKEFECRTFKQFYKWPKEKQDKFLKFLDKQTNDSFEYSVRMDNGFFLNEFLEKSVD